MWSECSIKLFCSQNNFIVTVETYIFVYNLNVLCKVTSIETCILTTLRYTEMAITFASKWHVFQILTKQIFLFLLNRYESQRL